MYILITENHLGPLNFSDWPFVNFMSRLYHVRLMLELYRTVSRLSPRLSTVFLPPKFLFTVFLVGLNSKLVLD